MSELASVEVEYEGEASGVRQNVSCFFDGVSVHDWSPTKELPEPVPGSALAAPSLPDLFSSLSSSSIKLRSLKACEGSAAAAALGTTREATVNLGEPTAEHTSTARPQVSGGLEWHAEHWGLKPSQIQELLVRLRAEPEWKASANVYTLVNEFIIPWTRGTGVGYALLVNGAQAQEVNIMVSHAWSENAEEFLETLLRSTAASDVLFVCALSIYQAQDDAGPSIIEQLGSDAEDSPFHRVLAHIHRCGVHAGCGGVLWRVGPLVKGAYLVLMLLALVCYCMPMIMKSCVATFHADRCISPASLLARMEEQRLADPSDAWMRYALHTSIGLFLGAMLVCIIWRRLNVYRGYMIVVPNREDIMYGRLWCVYEIFVAHALGVPVSLGLTLADAGSMSSRLAKCSSQEDEHRIKFEIEAKYGKDRGYQVIDRSICLTTRSSLIRAVLASVAVGFPTACMSVSTFTLTEDWSLTACTKVWGCFGNALGTGLVALSAFRAFKREQGRPQWRNILAIAGANTFVGFVFTVFLSEDLEEYSGMKCGLLPLILGIAHILVSAVLLIVSTLLMLRPPKKWQEALIPGDRAFLVAWLMLLVVPFLLLGMYELDKWSSDGYSLSSCYRPGEPTKRAAKAMLFSELDGFLPWSQLGKCLASFSGVWPFFFALSSNRRCCLFCVGSLIAFWLLSTFLTPYTVFRAQNWYQYLCYAVRCFLAITVDLVLPACVTLCVTKRWGLKHSGPGLGACQLTGLLVMLATALLCCKADWAHIFVAPSTLF